MTILEAILILERHQEWRTGSEEEMIDPKKLSQAIDMAIAELKSRAYRPKASVAFEALNKALCKHQSQTHVHTCYQDRYMLHKCNRCGKAIYSSID